MQVRDALAQRYAGAQARPGRVLPNEEDLAREYGVSVGTMRKALKTLTDEHVLSRRPGRGTFVNDPSSGDLAIRFSNIRSSDGQRVCGSVTRATVAMAPASEAECRRLQLHSSAPVFRTQRVRHDKGRPFMVEDIVLPAALFPDLDKREDGSHRIVVLARDYGILLGKAMERLSIAAAAPDIASSLELAPGSPILVLDRVICTLDGQRAEWRVGSCHLRDLAYVAENS